MSRTRALLVLAVITAIGGALRFYNLAWGAPYYHFHMDEHYVFAGADLLRVSMRDAALSGKFFMYGPLPMYVLNGIRWVYEGLAHPIALNVHQDQITYMVLGRALSATFGTAMIPLVYAIATRVSGRLAGLLSAAFLSLSVLHIRDSHFLSVDISMTFFCMLTWLALMRMAESGSLRSAVVTGMTFAAAIICKYTAVFMAVPIAVAHFFSPLRPSSLQPFAAWRRWVLRGLVPVATSIVTFLVLDPMVWQYFDKFLFDVRTQITEPHTGGVQPIWLAHFVNLPSPRLFWFTNLLWWGMGPALEVVSLAGVLWLLARRTRPALLAATVPIAYFAVAGSTQAPFIRYAIPFIAALSVSAGVLCADLVRNPKWRLPAAVGTLLVLGATAAYAAAYMNIFRQPDARVAAARYLRQELPYGTKVLVEPSQNIPPIGSYFYATDFNRDYVVWGPHEERFDWLRMYGLDTYRYLYDRRPTPDEKRSYIASRLALVDWIVMDDTYVQWYNHLPAAEYAVMQQHYKDLFDGRLGFSLEKTFKVYPSLFGYEINDDSSEFTFRLFDHPRVYIFKRTTG